MKKTPLFLLFMLVAFLSIQAQVAETHRLISDDIAAEDYFGNGMAVSGEYAIVGACYDDENGLNSGSAYIFRNNAGAWEQYQKIMPSDGQTNEFFALTVTISGDYAFAASIGANSYAGKVYVFHNDAGNWTEIATLIGSDVSDTDIFGYSMSISDDYAIIGAYNDDDNGDNSGAAYIFQNFSGTWSEIAKISANDGTENDFFGKAVSVNDDYIFVGADSGPNNSGANSGIAYIFHNNSGTWEQAQKIESADAIVGDHFGASVNISDDYAIIGADYKSGNEVWEGAAYVFYNNEGTWEQTAKLTASNPGSQKHFGNSVRITGDTLVVGSKGNISFEPYDAGSAYLFINNEGTWEEKAILQSSDIDILDQFAYVVDFVNNYIFIGSPRTDSDFLDAGAVYIFKFIFTNIITQPVSQENISFGTNITFFVEAEGIKLSYQWRKDEVNLTNGGNISGATTNELFINSVSNDDAGNYDCIVTGDYGVETSDIAVLSILTRINDLKNNNFSIYPNPTTGFFEIKNEKLKIKNIKITDITGKTIYNLTSGHAHLYIENVHLQIDISNQPTGIYFIKIQTENNIITKKIIKQ